MLHRSNKRENKLNEQLDNKVSENTISKEEFIMHNEDAKKVLEDIKRLRQSVEELKQTGVDEVPQEISQAPEKTYFVDTDDIIAAKQAILEQAKRDALAEQAKREELLRKQEEVAMQQQKALKAQRRAALMEEEAERKRLEAIEAERKAKETARRNALEAMEAERKARKEQAMLNLFTHQATASAEEMADFFDEEKPAELIEKDMETAKKELLSAQKQQEAKLDMISQVAERHTMKLAAIQQEKLNQQQELIKAEQEEVAAVLDEQKEQRIERLIKDEEAKIRHRQKKQEEKLSREEKHRIAKAEKMAKAQAEKEAKIAKALAEREARIIREQQKKAERIRRAEERELIKKAKKDAEARARLEQMRLEAKRQADAELGGGIVNVQGMTINTEIKEVAHVSIRDLFSIRTKKERKADTERERRKLERERRRRTEKARELLDISIKRAMGNYEKTGFAKATKKFYKFCETRKVALLTVFSIILIALVATAGVFNYYTAYAYSYNGKTLGIVKEKDDVLQITNLVQGALTEDKNVDVIIDAKKDIEFERVSTVGDDVKIDTSEDVLKRLTYMDELNVKAYCVFINGKKVGAVEDKDTAEEVFVEIKQKYTSDMDGAKIEKVEIIEDCEVKEDNISLDKVVSKEEMIDLLCTSGQKESLHTIVAGETLADIAKLYSMTEEDILKDNPNVDRKKLIVGDKLVIKQKAPILTIRITEKVTYEKVVEHKVKEKDSKDIYEGYTELEQAGEDGLSEVTSRIVLVNGEQVEEIPLVTTVKKKPVTEIVLVGIKERPPSVGSGKYIWPLEAGKYNITSRFGPRWGGFHYGLDLALPTGNKVFAADGGVVKEAGYSGGYGYLVTIDHQNGQETRYAHNSQLLVKVGDKVFQGQEIARSGNTGNSTGPHLHFEIRISGDPKNPMNYLP